MTNAIFLDRDGTIVEERGYICSLEQTEIFPFAYEAVRLMNEAGFKVFGITNQSAIARGICTEAQVIALHHQLIAQFAAEGAMIEKFYYCPYHTEGIVPHYRSASASRKPLPGMILQAAHEYAIDLSHSYMIGDHAIDIEAGINAGCNTVLVLTGKGLHYRDILHQKKITPTLISPNILQAIQELHPNDL